MSSADNPKAPLRWCQPWEDCHAWVRGDFEPSFRLDKLRKPLKAYAAYFYHGDPSAFDVFGVEGAARLKNLYLEPARVMHTITILGSWEPPSGTGIDFAECAMQITWTWSDNNLSWVPDHQLSLDEITPPHEEDEANSYLESDEEAPKAGL